MKKVVRILLAILMVMCLALGITACKSDCEKGDHTWETEGTVTKAATCTAKGVKTYKCSLCDATRDEEIAMIAHTPVDASVEATCTTAGKSNATKCSVCNAVVAAGTEIPAKGHTVTSWTVCEDDETKHEGVCNVEGCGVKVTEGHVANTEGTECTLCHANLGGGEDTCAHPNKTYTTTDATCTTVEVKHWTCPDCDWTNDEPVGEPLGHDFDDTIVANVTVTKEASCTAKGAQTVKCSRCNETENQEIDMIDHTLGEYQTNSEKHWKECSECHGKIGESNHGIAYTINEDTHTAKCPDCQYEMVAATEHTYDNGLCVCGKMRTENFTVTGLDAVIASVGTGTRYFVIGKITEVDKKNANVTIADETGKTLYLYKVWTSEGKYHADNTFAGEVGDVIVVWGSATTFKDSPQLSNPWLVELKGTKLTDAADLAITLVTSPSYVNQDYTLYAAEGLTWTVSEGTCITIENNTTAKVTTSNSLQEATLTASVTLNGVTKTKDFVVKVSPTGTSVLELDFKAGIQGITTTSEEQSFTVNGIELVAGPKCKSGGTYLMMYKDNNGNGYLANKTALPGSIVSLTFVKTSGSAAGTNYCLNMSASGALLGNAMTGSKYTKEPLTSSKDFDAAEGYKYFNISIDSANGQLEKVIIIYRTCEHEIIEKEALTATCGVPGYAAHYECSVCGDWFSDAAGATPLKKTYIIAEHTFEDEANHHAAVAATCEEDGNIEYYVCDVCGYYFKADKTTKITLEETVIGAIGHNYTGVAFVDDENGTTHSQTCKNDATHKNTEGHKTAKTDWEVGTTEHYRICEVCGAQYDKHEHVYPDGGDCECGAKDVVKHNVSFNISIAGGAKVIKASDDNEAAGLKSIAIENGNACEFRIVVTDGYTLGDVIVGDSTTPLVAGDNGIYTISNVTAELAVTVNVTAPAKTYKKVTELPTDLTKYKFLIVCEDANMYFDGSLDNKGLDCGNNKNANYKDITIVNNTIEQTDELNAATFTIDSNGNIKSASGYYISGKSATANGMTVGASAASNTISFDSNGNIEIKCISDTDTSYTILCFNTTADTASAQNTRFRFYKHTTYPSNTNFKAIQLYAIEI